ncbi:radiation-inducible immediate-early gene IEX-1 [Tiliqua scincoides]|uniref:radiation-inducible immediate-early gene IEX-1 n=1 Tax=Tiliqua scincoides TaxID=71010 RepID=UPI0034637B91
MNPPSHGPTSMCYACEPRLPALTMPPAPGSRRLPTGPQYFTFDPLPEVEQSSGSRKLSRTGRLKKRSRRVLYPPVVKRYYPAEERSYAKRLLFILLTIIFVQVYSAEEDLPLLIEENPPGCTGEGFRGSHCELFLLEQPLNASLPLEIMEVANATEWHWEDEEVSDSTVDITQFLEQSPAAF